MDNRAALFRLVDGGWNSGARRSHWRHCTSDVDQFFDNAGDVAVFRGGLFPSREWSDQWNPLTLQSADDACRLRQQATNWMERLLSGEPYVPTYSRLPQARSRTQRFRARPDEGELSCLFMLVDFDHILSRFVAEAVDPLTYLNGTEFLRYLSLDMQAEDVLSRTRGFELGDISIGDLVWIHGITPTSRLAEATSPLEALEQARSMATAATPEEEWTMAFRVDSFSCVEPTERTMCKLARVAVDGVTIEGEDRTDKHPVSNSFCRHATIMRVTYFFRISILHGPIVSNFKYLS